MAGPRAITHHGFPLPQRPSLTRTQFPIAPNPPVPKGKVDSQLHGSSRESEGEWRITVPCARAMLGLRREYSVCRLLFAVTASSPVVRTSHREPACTLLDCPALHDPLRHSRLSMGCGHGRTRQLESHRDATWKPIFGGSKAVITDLRHSIPRTYATPIKHGFQKASPPSLMSRESHGMAWRPDMVCVCVHAERATRLSVTSITSTCRSM